MPLALDTFAIAIAVGLRGIAPLRPALIFAVFEGTMPAVGVGLASIVPAKFESIAEYVGATILILLGLHVLKEAAEEVEEAESLSFNSLRAMVLAGFAVSLDELAIGFPLVTEHLRSSWCSASSRRRLLPPGF